MKKVDLGQTINAVANVGVIAGNVFLAVELGQNSEQIELQTREQLNARRAAIVDTTLENPELLVSMRKTAEELTQIEHDRLMLLGLKLLLNCEEQYYEALGGRLSEEDAIRAMRTVYHRERVNYGGPLAWPEYRDRASPGFVRWMEMNIVPK